MHRIGVFIEGVCRYQPPPPAFHRLRIPAKVSGATKEKKAETKHDGDRLAWGGVSGDWGMGGSGHLGHGRSSTQ